MTRTRTLSSRVPVCHRPLLAVASTLALAACAPEDGVVAGNRTGQLQGSAPEELAAASAAAGARAPLQPAAAPNAAAAELPEALDSAARYSIPPEGFSKYIAFGDSFVSGVGASDVTWKPCGTSPAAWPYGVQEGLGNPQIVFAACSGATTQDVVTTGGLKRQPQMSQLPAPETLDSALITIAIGGNDIKLDERISKCFKGSSSSSSLASSSSLWSSPSSACWDLDQLLNNIAAVVDESIAPSLDYTYRALRAAAPNATIVAVGYPHLVDTASASCDQTATGWLLNRARREKLNQLADAINTQVKNAATNAGIAWITDEVVAAFEGHGACAPDEWIVSADALLRTGNAGVAHPNESGHKAYAKAVLSGLSKVATRTTPVSETETVPPLDTEPVATPELPDGSEQPEVGGEPMEEAGLPAELPDAEGGAAEDPFEETEEPVDEPFEDQSGSDEAEPFEDESGVGEEEPVDDEPFEDQSGSEQDEPEQDEGPLPEDESND